MFTIITVSTIYQNEIWSFSRLNTFSSFSFFERTSISWFLTTFPLLYLAPPMPSFYGSDSYFKFHKFFKLPPTQELLHMVYLLLVTFFSSICTYVNLYSSFICQLKGTSGKPALTMFTLPCPTSKLSHIW